MPPQTEGSRAIRAIGKRVMKIPTAKSTQTLITETETCRNGYDDRQACARYYGAVWWQAQTLIKVVGIRHAFSTASST
ncbi:hypothetical protein EVAR_32959_1 [Eumeta japonica]|uniref:Uncharacterized protein n=1 Tax=Eumeta variegata TaxID=151549 RepID=A0A4C1X046_EUMVA|nr:hypothetical protein EVAR_32959_1 [Eumeta japonica]